MAKKKGCKICKKKFNPWTSFAKTCSVACALELVRRENEKDERKAHRKAKEGLKTRSDHLREAQVAFNRYIRARDHNEVCISCQKPPKKRNAGHYRSVGSAPELRFEERNVHLQCEHCNSYLSGNAIEYRINLTNKLGRSAVEWLEGHHEPKKYTIDDIKAIKVKYNKLARELEKLI